MRHVVGQTFSNQPAKGHQGSRLNADLVALASPRSGSLLGDLPYPVPLLDEAVE
jgi:hypothetical protein